ncbi:MAG: hypothetical protein ACMG6E_02245 [Candidatus Roizmanbacteria bacterium]
MLHIIAGDDSSASYKRFCELKDQYTHDQTRVHMLSEAELKNLDAWMGSSAGLFEEKTVYFFQEGIGDKVRKAQLKTYQDAELSLIILEQSAYESEIKRLFPKAKIEFFKLPQSLFTLLDGLVPTAATLTIAKLQVLMDGTADFGLFYMLKQRIRQLLLISLGQTSIPKLQAWQKTRLSSQARRWSQEQLLSFYDSLYRIEKQAKTSGSPYSLKEALEIVLCIFLSKSHC